MKDSILSPITFRSGSIELPSSMKTTGRVAGSWEAGPPVDPCRTVPASTAASLPGAAGSVAGSLPADP